MIDISVVIPTCNRKSRILFLLGYLLHASYNLKEVIVVDSGEDRLTKDELNRFSALNLQYVNSEKSVCIQRNKGIELATSEWIFVCDDDIEVPVDYVEKISLHIDGNPGAVAISGFVLQKEDEHWVTQYPITSTKDLLWKYIFKLSIWGEIKCKDNFISGCLKKYYAKKGNHISKAGWPVITNFSGEYFIVPAFGLGASIIKREWLLKNPYDEVLDSHGIGDNYGLSVSFPENAIHILTTAFVYHHQSKANRLQRKLQYYRRILALDYFRKTKPRLSFVKKYLLLWSLFGNALMAIIKLDSQIIKANLKLIFVIALNKNPYTIGAKKGEKIIQPT